MSLDRNNLDEINKALSTYHETRDPVLRAQIVDAFLVLTRSTARRIAGENLAYMDMDIDDLASVGSLGLLEAIDNYEPCEGAKFETYCLTRIRGSIIDSLRSFETSSKLRRSQINDEKRRRGRPTLEETESVPLRRKLSLDISNSENGNSFRDSIPDGRHADPISALSQAEVKEVIVSQCSETERLIIVLYYYEDLTFKNISKIIGLTQGRISQIHKNLLKKLRKRLGERRDELFAFEQ
ncbi:MAG: sigma-70 family RNA polymerase sigma factor [Planctomycetota bacterium]|nr:sigma-70 family RNA polymerase sigma factor [Planctomycetota bacterium]MDA1141186.1 sigma-70 family RNA polymerase sigma factor [Planctomycetota bacterium]